MYYTHLYGKIRKLIILLYRVFGTILHTKIISLSSIKKLLATVQQTAPLHNHAQLC